MVASPSGEGNLLVPQCVCVCDMHLIHIWLDFFLNSLDLFWWVCKAPVITDPPPTTSTTLSKKQELYIYIVTLDTWHVTHDTWNVTSDTWHLTPNTWHVICDIWWGVNILLNLSSLALTVWDRQCLEDFERKDHRFNESANESVNDEDVCRTALATPGVLISFLDLAFYMAIVAKWTSVLGTLGGRPITLMIDPLEYVNIQ